MGSQLYILSQKEIQQIYGLPKLTSKQRAIYFDLTPTELELLRNYRTPQTKIYFILLLFTLYLILKCTQNVTFLLQTDFKRRNSLARLKCFSTFFSKMSMLKRIALLMFE